MTRRVRLDFEGVYTPTTRGPDADDVANALVAAAKATDELAALAQHGTAVLAGSLPLRARWLALAALRDVWPRCLPHLARRWADGGHPGAALKRAQAMTWWNDGVRSALAFWLCDAHRG